MYAPGSDTATFLQLWARTKLRKWKAERRAAAVIIQAWWRCAFVHRAYIARPRPQTNPVVKNSIKHANEGISSLVQSSYVPVGYRVPDSEVNFYRRLDELHDLVCVKGATRIQRWWRSLLDARRTREHEIRMRQLVLLNAKATVIQRWWRTWLRLGKVPSSNRSRKHGALSVALAMVRREELLATRGLQHGNLHRLWTAITDAKRQKASKQLIEASTRRSRRRKKNYMERNEGRYASVQETSRHLNRNEWNESTQLRIPRWYSKPRTTPL